MASNEEWNVPNSDDERDETVYRASGDGVHDIPIQILEHYEEIDKNKVLELNVQEFRQAIPNDSDNNVNEECSSAKHESKDLELVVSSNKDTKVSQEVEEDKQEAQTNKRSNEPSEFDYLDEPTECQGHIPKRTPKSGRLPKKRIGTLKNVISNLKRFREMDTSGSNDVKTVSCNEVKDDGKHTNEDSPTDASNT